MLEVWADVRVDGKNVAEGDERTGEAVHEEIPESLDFQGNGATWVFRDEARLLALIPHRLVSLLASVFRASRQAFQPV